MACPSGRCNSVSSWLHQLNQLLFPPTVKIIDRLDNTGTAEAFLTLGVRLRLMLQTSSLDIS